MSDGSVEEFIDIRRKVGNQVLRAYLLDTALSSGRVKRVNGSLRGPKNEFQDFARYVVVRATSADGVSFSLLAQTGVYENIRIVATGSEDIAGRSAEEIIRLFTEALQDPERFQTVIVLSTDSRLVSP